MFYRMMQQPPIFFGRSFTNNDVNFNRTYNELARAQSPLIWPIATPHQYSHIWEEQYKVSFMSIFKFDHFYYLCFLYM